MEQQVIINVAGRIGQIIASMAYDGELLYQFIREALNSKRTVTLDFEDIDLVSFSFLNACIGRLYNQYDRQFLAENLRIENLNPGGEATLKRMQLGHS
jgi:hypothetical protein